LRWRVAEDHCEGKVHRIVIVVVVLRITVVRIGIGIGVQPEEGGNAEMEVRSLIVSLRLHHASVVGMADGHPLTEQQDWHQQQGHEPM
jgi:hypothetical protein